MPPSILPSARPASPVDEDLQTLYNEVWAGFADEPPAASSERDLENIYNVYGGENDYPASQPAVTVSPVSPQTCANILHLLDIGLIDP